jgi:glycosyltransferase involved in cell wall biosynthesis
MNTVDVLVPCYNYARFLPRCVTSVLTQHGVTVRVLIIDDASTDDTQIVGRQLAAADPRVAFRRHEKNKGHIATYNEGMLDWVTADYSLVLSADDALTPGAMWRAVRLLNRHPEAGMTYGRALVIGHDHALGSDAPHVSDEYQLMAGPEFIEHCCAFANPVPAPTAIVRTSVQQRIGGYQAHLPHTGDMEMWMRFATLGPIVIMRAVQAYYGWHGGNMGIAYYEATLSDLREQKDACADVLTAPDFPKADGERLMQIVKRRVGEQAFWMASQAFDDGDGKKSRTCLEFAQDLHPGLRRTRMWRRFQAKKLIGSTMWRRIRPVLKGARRVPSVPRSISTSHFQCGQLTGWWPGSAADA